VPNEVFDQTSLPVSPRTTGEKEARYCENFKDLKENPAIAVWLPLRPGKRRGKNRLDRWNQLVGPKALKGTICTGCNISELAGHIQPHL
jgi:hypothetical protein